MVTTSAGVISAYTERRAGSALAVDAVTSNDYFGWFFWKRERDCTAAASSVSHRKILQLLLSKQSLPMDFLLSFDGFETAERCRLIWRDGDYVGVRLGYHEAK
jgi:hypothetical protein